MIRMIFSTVRAPQEPALTVESLAISATVRPSMVAVPVITPSAGSPSARTLAYRPSSVKLSSSVSSAIRSRANSLPAFAAASWYLGAPPRSMPARTAGRSECSATTGLYLGPAPDPFAHRVQPARPGLGALDEPGGPGGGVGRQRGGHLAGIQFAPDGDVEVHENAARRLDPVPHGRDVRRGRLAARALAVDRDETVPAGGPGHRALRRQFAAYPDGYPWLLHRAWREGDRPDRVVLALVGEGLPGAQPGQDIKPLVQEFGPDAGVGRLAEQAELTGRGAQADPEDDPPVAEQVQRGGLLSQLPRPPPGDRGDHR